MNWLYKDEEEIRAATINITNPIEQYGKGFKIMQRMGCQGKCLIGKCQEGITEPIQPHSQLTKDKSGLGYDQHIQPVQKQDHHQNPRWKIHVTYQEESWKEALHRAAAKISKEQKDEEYEKQQEEISIQREEASYKHIHHVQAMAELDQATISHKRNC